MKKIILSLALIFTFSNFAFAIDATPLELGSGQGTFIELEQNTTPLINIDKMKRKNQIEKIEQEKEPVQKVKLNKRAIDHQRALNFMQNQNNSLFPTF